MSNAWTREAGTRQGRVAPVGWVPPEGAHVLVLGFDLPGHTEVVAIGDFVQEEQTATFDGGATLLRLKARLRPPVTMPAGVAWRLALLIDGVARATRILAPGRTLDCADIAANIAKMTGAHTVALRLELAPA